MKTITREGIKRIVGPVSGSGGSRGAGGGDISLAGLASEAWVEENYISKAFFNRLFTIHSASGVIDPNDPDEEQTIDSIEALVGFWTEQYVSALGQNSGGGGGGGGGGVTLNQPLEAINNAGLSAPTTAGTMLVWYNGGWTYSPGARLQIGGITATGTVLVNSSVTANSFIKTGGTSSMFLKADGSVDTNTYASETWVSQNYVSIQFFETLFNAINAQGVKVNANSITGIDSIKAMFGLWTERYLSALGQNSGGGGGGGVTLNQPLSGINNAGLNAPGTSGSLLVWNGTTWTYSAAASIIATTATFYGNSYAAGFAVTNKDNTYVLLAGGGTKLLSELGGHTSVSYNGNVYSPSSGVVALGYLTTSVKVNSSTYSVNSSGLVDIGSVVTAVKIAGTLTPYSPTAGVVEIPAYPTIPTNVSAFTNDAGYVSTSVSLSDPHLVLASPSGSGGPASFRALVASDIPDLSSIYATSDTWRTVQCNGVSIGNNTLNLVAGTNVAISASNGTLTFSSTDTNTINTAGAVQLGSTKLYLVGAASQGDGVTTYSNVNCYIGTDGCLYSDGSKVMTAASGYLPTSGGTMTGTILANTGNGLVVKSLNSNSYNEGITILPAPNNYSLLSLVSSNATYRCCMALDPDGDGHIYRTNGANSVDIRFPFANGTFALTSDIVYNTAGSTQLGSAKLFLVGASTQTTYGITYSNSNCYIGTDGCLYSDGSKVMTAASGYLPTSGGTMTGTILANTGNGLVVKSLNSNSYNEGITILPAPNNYSLLSLVSSNATYRCCMALDPDGDGHIYMVNGANSVDMTFPYANGTFALTSDIVYNTAGAGANSARIWLVGSSAYNTTYSTTYTNLYNYIDTDNNLYTKSICADGFNNELNGIFFRQGFVTSDVYNLSIITWKHNGASNDHISINAYGGVSFCTGSNTRQERMRINNSGYVGIGTTSPSQLLHVAGNVQIQSMVISQANNYVTFTTSNQNVTFDVGSAGGCYCTKGFYGGSDIRKKDFINNIDLNISAIAQAPIFNFTWKDYPDTRPSVGTSAQYWEKVLPYSVSEGPDGYLSFDYGATALAAAVLTARKVSEHEQRIAELERENKVLWNMIATLKAS